MNGRGSYDLSEADKSPSPDANLSFSKIGDNNHNFAMAATPTSDKPNDGHAKTTTLGTKERPNRLPGLPKPNLVLEDNGTTALPPITNGHTSNGNTTTSHNILSPPKDMLTPSTPGSQAGLIVDDDDDDDKSSKCRTYCCNSKMFLVTICLFVVVQSAIVSGYVPAILTTLEKRFGLTSTQTGLIVSAYEMTSVVASLFSGYIFGHAHRPRVIGIGGMIMGVGMLMFIIPQFAEEAYTYSATGDVTLLCRTDTGCTDTTRITWVQGIFLPGQMLIGIGAAPLWTIAQTYLHDNVPSKSYSVYSAIMNAMGAVGPAIGFLLGSMFLSFFVHPSQDPDFGETDSRWIGAWWLGCFFLAALCFIVSIPIMFFPRAMTPAQMGIKTKGSETETSGQEEQDVVGGIQLRVACNEVPKRTKAVFRSLLWVFITIMMVTDGAVVQIAVAFIPKSIENLFGVAANKATIYAGGVLIPSACIGILGGGLVIKKAKLQTKGMLRFALGCVIISVSLLMPLFFLVCPNADVAGVNVKYSASDPNIDLISSCNANCSCSLATYSPVCGADDRMYVTPCHAGCSNYTDTYATCGCVGPTANGTAGSGSCEIECWYLYLWLPLLFLCIVTATLAHNPALVLTMRSVDRQNTSIAISLQFLFLRGLGYAPAPIYMGKALDDACLQFKEGCNDETGSCVVYDNTTFINHLIGVIVALRLVTLVFLVIANLLSPKLALIGDNQGGRANAVAHGRENPAFVVGEGDQGASVAPETL